MTGSVRNDDALAVFIPPEDLNLATEHQEKTSIPVTDIPQQGAVRNLALLTVAAHDVDLLFGQLRIELVVSALRAGSPGGRRFAGSCPVLLDTHLGIFAPKQDLDKMRW